MKPTTIRLRLPLLALAALLPCAPLAARDDIPLLRPEEREAVDTQTDAFNAAIQPILGEAAKSTVRIWSGRVRLGYGTVIGDGTRVLTKWSELARARNGLLVQTGTGETRDATISGVYADEDLAVLEIAGSPLPAVSWHDQQPPLGGFLAAPQPDGRPAAFGVVSVAARNLRETDRAFLGVEGDLGFDGRGVRIRRVTPESGAAGAGLRGGDVILKVGEREISGLLELQNSLVGIAPGTTIEVIARTRADEEKTFQVLLGNRPQLPQFPRDRLGVMERMGGPISAVRDAFGNVIQTDMRLRPDQIGGPVVDLEGRAIGITMARADRTRSFVMPAAAIGELLATQAGDPSIVQVRQSPEMPAMQGPRAFPRANRQSTERMRQHLSEMQRLMEFMREEMEDIDPR